MTGEWREIATVPRMQSFRACISGDLFEVAHPPTRCLYFLSDAVFRVVARVRLCGSRSRKPVCLVVRISYYLLLSSTGYFQTVQTSSLFYIEDLGCRLLTCSSAYPCHLATRSPIREIAISAIIHHKNAARVQPHLNKMKCHLVKILGIKYV